jgi:hypothetical protein
VITPSLRHDFALESVYERIAPAAARHLVKIVMDLTTVGDVIAERRFVLVRPDGSSRDILVSLGKPEPHPGSEDFYYCRYQIVGFKAQIISWASGVDGFQAIQLASLKLGIELANNQEGQVFWHGELHLGLPVLEDTSS